MSDWTLGDVKARNMEILALCEQESCRHMFAFNLDALIEGVGPDTLGSSASSWQGLVVDPGGARHRPGSRLANRPAGTPHLVRTSRRLMRTPLQKDEVDAM